MNKSSGFSILEGLLIIVIAGMLGFTGWFVWHSKQIADKNNSQAAADSSPPNQSIKTQIKDYQDCVHASGSKIQETYPQICVTKDGKQFTQSVSTDRSGSTSNSGSSAAVQKVAFSVLPGDLKKAVLANVNTLCAKNGQLLLEGGAVDKNIDQNYVANSAAFISQCNTQALYAYTSGQWKFISKTQYGFSCSSLKKYNVPKALVSASVNGQCLDSSNKFVDYN